MVSDKTGIFDVTLIKKKLIAATLKEVAEALKERGFRLKDLKLDIDDILADLAQAIEKAEG